MKFIAHYFVQSALLALGLSAAVAVAQDQNVLITDGQAQEKIDKEAAQLWKLKGGGEIVGMLIKETPDEVFVDIGPRIISIPADSVDDRVALNEIDDADTEAGLGSGVYDSATGALTFRSRDRGGDILSQQEVLDEVKKSVVLVSNPKGLGTGWVISEDGLVVTNQHVVGDEAYQVVTVFVKKGTQWEKKRIQNNKVLAYSSLLDIAIVKMNMDEVEEENIKLQPIGIAEPGSLESGDTVYAVGNPGMGGMVLDHTISEGIVSSLARNFNDIIYVQTTAAVNPGNSGGPLVNKRGEVVGLVTLKALFQEGIAFALPINYVLDFIDHKEAYSVTDANNMQGYRYHRPQ